ncbi:MAG: PQQ-binding-like beta-propeller repeat protein [Planctomycetes bacterium]|nr:PQQ-binding-like beta-propeller repeat protein [Planctomycetota bacterium]
MTFRATLFTVMLLSGVGNVLAAESLANWPRWRGPQDTGSIEKGNYPVKWNVDRVLWKTELPGKGCSTPIVWNRRIYVTAPTNGLDSLIAFDGFGKRLWHAEFGKENPGKHRNGSGCNPSPVTDGDSVFVYFKSGTLAAVDLAGEVRWETNLVERYGRATLFWDHGTSPVLTETFVVMTRMHKGESWLAAFDKITGDMKWKVPRNYKTPTEGDHGYATPLVIQHRGAEGLLVWGAQHLTLHDVTNGKVLWTCGGFNPESRALWPSIATPVVSGEFVVVAFGRNDRGIPRLHGIRLGGQGDVTATHRVWKRMDIGTFVPTPVAYEGKVYVVGDKGRITCLDPATGKTIWTDAFPKHRAKFYGSPLIAGGKLYAPREDGVVFVAEIKDGFKLLAENPMGEPIIASPVPISNRLLIRGTQNLFCISDE